MARLCLCVLIVVATARAEEPDGAVAAAARWSGPAGPASGSFRSAAIPVMGDVVEAWSLKPKSIVRIEAPPVLWDGRGFVIGTGPKGRVLAAFDVRNGRELGSKTILSKSALKKWSGHVTLHVWDHIVYVEQSGKPLKAYRFSGRTFRLVWTYRNVRPLYSVAICENEIYSPVKGAYMGRLRPYRNLTRWTPFDSNFEVGGRPAVYGPLVFMFVAQRSGRVTRFFLIGLRRRDGKMLVRKRVAAVRTVAVSDERAGRVTVTDSAIYIESRWDLPSKSGSAHSHVILPCKISGTTVTFLGNPTVATFRLPPAHHKIGTLILMRNTRNWKHEWWLARGSKGKIITKEEHQPDLFRSIVPPTILGDIVYFGTYAVDMVTREILWRLPIEKVTFAAVPADGLVIVVDKRETLRAYSER